MRIHVLALVLLTPALLGCLGGDDDAGGESLQKARASVTASLGGIEGTVTDGAIQPIEAATVTLLGVNRTTETESDGSFAFSEVEPGTYTISFELDGFVPTTKDTEVKAGRIAFVDVILAQRFTEEPFTQELELAGFFECGFAAGVHIPPPANISSGIISYPVCGDVNDRANNATNDRFEHFFELEAPVHTVIIETHWQPGTGGFSDQLWVDMVPQGFHCGSISTCNWSFIDHWGPNPLTGRIDQAKFQEVQDFFIEQCEDGEDEWCGYSFFDEGWPLWLRVYPRWECQPAGLQTCVLLQQDFTHLVTAFYNAPAPEGYSITG